MRSPTARFLCGFVATIAALSSVANAQGTVTGTIRDSATATPVRGATVTVRGAGRPVTSNDDGRFTIPGVPGGSAVVDVRAPGYRPLGQVVAIAAGAVVNVELVIVRVPTVLGAARIDAVSAERNRFENSPGVAVTTLGARALASVPRLGAADPVRVVQLLPGVVAKNDFSSGLSVRGGESDQNLVLLDGYPVYNPFHVGGVFSTFIDATVREVELHTGAIPAGYGGRLSSLLDVKSANEERAGLHGTVDLSALAALGTVGGATRDGRGSWMIAARRTYADRVAEWVSDERVPYHFADGQAHGAWTFANGAALSFTGYTGRDVLDGSYATFQSDSRPGAGGGAFYYAWGNQLLGATLALPTAPYVLGISIGDSARYEQRVSVSHFSSRLDLGGGSTISTNDLTDWRARGALSGFGRAHDVTVGWEVSALNAGYEIAEAHGSLNHEIGRDRPVAYAAYGEDLWRVSPRFIVSTGFRVEALPVASWSAMSPRLSAKWFASRDAAFTLAAGRFTQWTHSLALEDNPIRLFDAWRVSNADNPVSSAWSFVGGHERWLSASRFVRVEAFYKRYESLLEPDLQENVQFRTGRFAPATGTSYGADVMLRQLEVGPLSGWIAYTYAVSRRQIDTVTYAPAQDRRHDFNLVLSYRRGPYTAGARVGYASGMPYTDIVAQLPHRRFDPVTATWGGDEGLATYQAIGGARNGSRLPPTRRVDLHLERTFQLRHATVTAYASVINATNAQNVLYYSYDYFTAPGTRRSISQLPIIPSIGGSIAY